MQREGVECYRTFIRGLLDITDNIVDGKRRAAGATWCATTVTIRTSSSRPTRAPRTFSDIANALSAEYGFWLGDAFASGGSAGYDHKKMAHHRARRLGVREAPLPRARASTRRRRTSPSPASATWPATCSATACCCRRTSGSWRAFNHQHIFIDPNPDAARSFSERERMFELPRSIVGRLRPRGRSRRAAASTRATPRTIALTPQVAGAARRSDAARATPTRADPRDPQAAGRPAVERRHRHVREGLATRPTARVGDRAERCGARRRPRAALPRRRRRRQSRPVAARPRSSTRCAAAASTPTSSTTRAASTARITRSTSRSCSTSSSAGRKLTPAARNKLLVGDDRRRRRARAARQLPAEPGDQPAGSARARASCSASTRT